MHASDRCRQRGHAGLHHRVAEAAQLRAFDVCDGAEPHEGDVAARHLHAETAAVHVVLRRARIGLQTAAAARLHRLEAERAEQLAHQAHRSIAHAREHERRRCGHEVLRRIDPHRHARRHLLRVSLEIVVAGRAFERRRALRVDDVVLGALLRLARRKRRAAFERPEALRDRTAHLGEHRRDRCDTGNGLHLERRPRVRVGTGETAVEIDRAPAHAADVLRHVEPRVRGLDEDQLLRRTEVLQHADDFDVEAFGLGALEDGEAVALHAVFDLVDADRPGLRLPVGQRNRQEETAAETDRDRADREELFLHGIMVSFEGVGRQVRWSLTGACRSVRRRSNPAFDGDGRIGGRIVCRRSIEILVDRDVLGCRRRSRSLGDQYLGWSG